MAVLVRADLMEGVVMRARGLPLVAAICLAIGVETAQGQSETSRPSPVEIAQARTTPRAPSAASIGEGQAVAKVNSWTLGLASGLPEGTFLRFGAEIARNLNDGDELRIIPMVTNGATDNVKDLIYLKGVDVALTNADVLEHFKTVERIPNIERRVHYVSSMYIGHIHLLVRADINSLQDLEGKKVSFHTPGAGASVSAPILFRRLGVKVEPVFVNNAIALEQMKTGELAGLVNTGGKPQDLFTKFKNDHGYKFLSVPFDRFEDLYVPSVFTADDYPGYIKPGEKVEALGVPVVLAVYNWPKESDRFRRIQRFIEYYFDRFDGFQKPPYHPAWKSISLSAKVPGWTRYWAAEEKLKAAAGKQPQSAVVDPVLARQQAARAAPTSSAEQERLFQQFLEWSRTQRK
jgi:TRAP transporter TAXI family solute receptor